MDTYQKRIAKKHLTRWENTPLKELETEAILLFWYWVARLGNTLPYGK